MFSRADNAGQEWRLGLLKSVMEIRADNWETLFDDEDDSEMVENVIAMVITDSLSGQTAGGECLW